jgi:hypothetical protein
MTDYKYTITCRPFCSTYLSDEDRVEKHSFSIRAETREAAAKAILAQYDAFCKRTMVKRGFCGDDLIKLRLAEVREWVALIKPRPFKEPGKFGIYLEIKRGFCGADNLTRQRYAEYEELQTAQSS